MAQILPSSDASLNLVLAWLESEYDRDHEGFWCHREIIQKAHHRGEMLVALENAEPVGFSVGRFGEDIVCVRSDRQRLGIGKQLFQVSLKKARDAHLPVMRVECSPASSLPYWLGLGFEEITTYNRRNPRVRLVLDYEWPVPTQGIPVPVTLEAYPPSALYRERSTIRPIRSFSMVGRYDQTGTVHLPYRITLPHDWLPAGENIVVALSINGDEVFFDKAKRDEAEAYGVREIGSDYVVDRLTLNPGFFAA